MSHKVHSQGMPFSWENKPGVTKKNQDDRPDQGSRQPPVSLKLLPPPPCPPENSSRAHHHFHDLQVPLPPCWFQPPPASSGSSKGMRKQDDPFLSAYLECTKSSSRKGKSVVGGTGKRSGFGSGILRSSFSVFSCKNSCSVRDDSMVRVSHLPISRSESRERGLTHP